MQRAQILLLSILGLLMLSPASALDIDSSLRTRLALAIEHAGQHGFRDDLQAQVWLAERMSRLPRKLPNNGDAVNILKAVHREASHQKLSPNLVLAVIQVESNFDQYAWSRSGAVGLMQVMPFWLEELKKPQANLFDININLAMGCTILRYYLDMEKGNVDRALARYNGSLGKTEYPRKVKHALKYQWAGS